MTGTNRTHRTFLVIPERKSHSRDSPPHTPSPSHSDLENAYAQDSEGPAPASDELLSLTEFLSEPAPTLLECPVTRPPASGFGRVVTGHDSEGGWRQKEVRKRGSSNLWVAQDAGKFRGGDGSDKGGDNGDDESNDGQLWTEAEKGTEKEGYSGAASGVLACFGEVAALQEREARKGRKSSKIRLRERLGLKLSDKIISWPRSNEGKGTMAVFKDGVEELQTMAEQARKENQTARIEQLAHGVQVLVNSLRE